MKTRRYSYLQNGFEGVLYDAGNDDDRLLIVIQGLKGLELPQKMRAIPHGRCLGQGEGK